MEEVIINALKEITNIKTLFLIATVVIVVDTASGLIKAFYLKKYNSSINRKGIASKLMWYVLLALGSAIQVLLGTPALNILIIVNCVLSEVMSVFENAKDCGATIKITEFVVTKEDKIK